MKNLILPISIVFILCIGFGSLNISAQARAPIIWSQSAMTAQAKCKWTLTKKKWVDFTFDFPNGKPNFNLVGGKNLTKVKYEMYKPDGTLLTDISLADSAKGKYILRFRLKSPYSNSLSPVTFWLDIWLE